MLSKKVVCFLVVLFLGSCTSYGPVASSSSYTVGSDKGLVVMSITRSSTFDVPFILQYHAKGDISWLPAKEIPTLADDDWEDLAIENGSEDYDKLSGRLVVFESKPGRYAFDNMIVEDGYEQARWGNAGDYFVPFDVDAGKVTYIGNVHMQYTNLNNTAYIIKSDFRLFDESARDLKLFAEKFPSINKSLIKQSEHLGSNVSSESVVATYFGVENPKVGNYIW